MADQAERVILEAEETPVLESVGRANTALDRFASKKTAHGSARLGIGKPLPATIL